MNKCNALLGFLACWLSLISVANADDRLISTDAAATELVIALGYSHQLVAIDVTSQLPAGHAPLPNIGYHRNLSAEGLLSLHPDLIIGNEHMGPPSAIQALEQAKIRVIRLDSANNIDALRNNISRLGGALSARTQSDVLLKNLDNKLHTLQSNTLKDKRIAFLLAMDPTKLRLAGDGTAGDAFITLLGGTNVGDFANYRNVSAESLLAMQADIILVTGEDSSVSVSSLLNAIPILAHTPAGQNNAIVGVDGNTLVAGLSIASVDEALRLKKLLQAIY